MALLDLVPAIGSAVNAAGNVASTLLTNKANKELAEYSFDMQRQLIREQNAYNSPLQQMARYQEAGLNPSLIYGSGQASAGNQSSIAKYEAPHLQAPQVDLNSAIQMALQARELKSRINLQDEQAYAQRMLGLGYEQDAYSKQIDTAVKAFKAGLSTPPGVWSSEDLDSIRKGDSLRKWNLEISGMEAANAYKAAETELAKSSAAKNDWWTNHIGPALESLYNAQKEGRDIENVIRGIEKDAYEALSSIGGTGNASTLAKLFVDLLKILAK